MSTPGFVPMKIHKRFVILLLRAHPEDRDKIIPGWEGTVEEFIEALEQSPGEFFVDGELQEGAYS